MKVAVVMGTRPEIIKLASVIEKLRDNSYVIFSGQHYDYNLSMQFIEELKVKTPDVFIKLGSSEPPIQIAKIIMRLAKIFSEQKPDTVIVEGDTNTALAGAIASLKSGIPISHVEAGPRSFDWRMPEEHNRIQVDHISELLFAPSKLTRRNLLFEHVHGKIYVTGNTVIDAINKYSKISKKKSNLDLKVDNFILMTLHRGENVDDRRTLSSIVKAVLDSRENVIFPVHPRTLKRLKEFSLYSKLQDSDKILLFGPVGYFDMLELMKKCSFIITDSGGIQQEATSPRIRKRVLVTRKTTDSPEAVKAGVAKVVGADYSKIISAIKKTSKNPKLSTKETPYGRGEAAKHIVKVIRKYF